MRKLLWQQFIVNTYWTACLKSDSSAHSLTSLLMSAMTAQAELNIKLMNNRRLFGSDAMSLIIPGCCRCCRGSLTEEQQADQQNSPNIKARCTLQVTR